MNSCKATMSKCRVCRAGLTLHLIVVTLAPAVAGSLLSQRTWRLQQPLQPTLSVILAHFAASTVRFFRLFGCSLLSLLALNTLKLAEVTRDSVGRGWGRCCTISGLAQFTVYIEDGPMGRPLLTVHLEKKKRRAERFHWISPMSFKKINQWAVVVDKNDL